MRALRILFIDDREGLVKAVAEEVEGLGVTATVRNPDEVTLDDLQNADLTLLDYDLREWYDPKKADAKPLLLPPDGLGFAQVVRAHHRAHENSSAGAVGLLTDKLDELFISELAHVAEHSVARLHNLEWAFRKTSTDLAQRIVDLAEATHQARYLWQHEMPVDVTDETADARRDAKSLRDFLGMDDKRPWDHEAWIRCAAAQPPSRELADASGGLTMVRWLAQRILPYPTFLLDDRYAAVLLGFTPESFAAAMSAERFAEQIANAQYDGALSAFSGRRWWRAGLHHVLSTWTDGVGASNKDTVERLNKDMGIELTPVPRRAVIALNARLEPYAAYHQREAVVRIRPDDWPVFAAPGFAPIELFAHPDDEHVSALKAYVEPADLPLLEENRLRFRSPSRPNGWPR